MSGTTYKDLGETVNTILASGFFVAAANKKNPPPPEERFSSLKNNDCRREREGKERRGGKIGLKHSVRLTSKII